MNMNRLKIKVRSVEDIGKLINICSCSKYKDIDINLYDGRTVVDAKSIMGVFAMCVNYQKEFEIEILTDNNTIAKDFYNSIMDFII